MSLISFIADAGEKLLGTAAATPAPTTGGGAPDLAQLNATAGAAIAKYVASQDLSAQNLNITYDGASKTVTVTGVAPDQATKEKIVLCCGNVHSVAKVNDQLTVAQNAAAASTLYEVKAGDSLSKIAKSVMAMRMPIRKFSMRINRCSPTRTKFTRDSNFASPPGLEDKPMGILDILKQYSNPGTTPSGDVVGHFDSVAQQASPQDLGSGIAAALRSDATPAFGQAIGSLFGQSNPNQKAGVLNEILQTLGPAGLATAGGGILGRILGTGAAGPTTSITPTQAAQVSPSD